MARRVTMKEVAREAGVHQTTVSLALRDHHSLPAATRARIRAVADRLGYRPNPLVSALMSVRRRGRASREGSTLAFLTAYPTRDGWRRSANYQYLFEATSARARELGYRQEAFWLTEPGMTADRMRRILLARGIRGVLVCPLPSALHVLDFDFNDFAGVALGYTVHRPALDQVAIDYYGILQMAVGRVRERGFRRITFFTSRQIDERVNHLSLGAYLAERRIDGSRLLEPFLCRDEEPAAIFRWITERKPDAIITSVHREYQMLDGLVRKMDRKRRPRLYAVDARPDAREPGVVQALDDQARAAVDLVTSRLERGEFGPPRMPQTVLVRGTWREEKVVPQASAGSLS
jgi:LacI family transcriptional regulator